MVLIIQSVLLSTLITLSISSIPEPPSVPPSPADGPPICVVGGGISGLHTTILLQNKGLPVLLLEQTPIVGGKMMTYRQKEGSSPIELGALIFTKRHQALLRYIEEFQLTPLPFNQSDIRGIDDKMGIAGYLSSILPDQKSKVEEAAERYLVERAKFESQLQFEYLEATPELGVSIGDWLNSRGLDVLRPTFWYILTVHGYGALEEDTAALYGLRLVDRDTLDAVLKGDSTFTLKEGMDILAMKMASKIQRLYSNHAVTGVERRTGKTFGREDLTDNLLPSLSAYDFGKGRSTILKCSKIVLAFPPLLRMIDLLVNGLTMEERELLDQVKVHKYSSAIHVIPGLEGTHYIEAKSVSGADGKIRLVVEEPRGTGEVVGLTRQGKENENIYSSYSWIRGDFDRQAGFFDALNMGHQCRQTLKKISKGAKTIKRETFEYFPHVDGKAVTQGFFKQFQKIQGQGGLYYASTMLGFEYLEAALEMSEAFVAKYF